jgi:hypothetical protein
VVLLLSLIGFVGPNEQRHMFYFTNTAVPLLVFGMKHPNPDEMQI